jgi:hypothetical protein
MNDKNKQKERKDRRKTRDEERERKEEWQGIERNEAKGACQDLLKTICERPHAAHMPPGRGTVPGQQTSTTAASDTPLPPPSDCLLWYIALSASGFGGTLTRSLNIAAMTASSFNLPYTTLPFDMT